MVMVKNEELPDWIRRVSDFSMSLIITSIPVIVLSLVSLRGYESVLTQAAVTDELTGLNYGILWIISATYWLIAFIYTICFYLVRYLPVGLKRVKREVYRGGGLWGGIIIGFLFLQYSSITINNW